MIPLAINVSQYGTSPDNIRQIEENLARGLPEITPALLQHDGTMVLVASGPSMPQFLEEIKSHKLLGRPVCAINNAHDFLVENGITPDVALTVDPRPMPQSFRLATEKTVYLMASRVNPDVLDRLKGRKVILWHSWSDQESGGHWEGKFLFGGGSTSGLRALNVFYYGMGFRKFILYGYDSCLADDGETKRFNGDKTGKTIDVICGGKKFVCNYAMAQQANDLPHVYDMMPDIQLDVRGGGLIAAEIEELKKRGLIP